MTAKADTRDLLHHLIDEIPRSKLRSAKDFLEFLRGGLTEDPVARAVRKARRDDEPLTEEDRKALREARADVAAGRVMSHEDFLRRFDND